MPPKRNKRSSNYSKYKKKLTSAVNNAHQPDPSLADSEITLEYTVEHGNSSAAPYPLVAIGFLVAAVTTGFMPLLGCTGFAVLACVALSWRCSKGVQRVRIDREGLTLSFKNKEDVFYPHKGNIFFVIPGPTGVGRMLRMSCIQVRNHKNVITDYDISLQDGRELHKAIWSRGHRVAFNHLVDGHSIWPSLVTDRHS